MAPRNSGTTGAATRVPARAARWPQSFRCEWCDAPACADDWNYVAQALVCPTCLENLTEQGHADVP